MYPNYVLELKKQKELRGQKGRDEITNRKIKFICQGSDKISISVKMSEKERFYELVKERDFIESSLLNSMKELEELGIGPKDSLLDSEGYPRGDIDLYRVRALKSSIASTY